MKKFNLIITRFNYDGQMVNYSMESGTVKQLLPIIQKFTDAADPTKSGVYTHSKELSGYTSLIWIDQSTRTIGDHS